ncbi:MAG: MBL fold metallo-hydrolase [Gemmatimonadales bacterium]
MFFKRFYDTKLAQASYLVGCTASGEALVVDPNRDPEPYLQAADAEGLRIVHVTETHIHADFVSGARELAHRAGARLYLSDAGGEDWRYGYSTESGATPLYDGSCFRVGAIEVRALHVPGHTPEHLSFFVTDSASASEPMGVFTGDFIFVGDVGRPDLLERAVNLQGTMEESARQVFRSLQRFRELPDYLQIWPGHGAGSACGKALGALPQTTLGYEKRFNWAFGVSHEGEFVRAVLAGQPDPPCYFAEMKRINQSGPPLLGRLRRPARLPPKGLAAVLARRGTVVDTRQAPAFMLGAVPGTINIPFNRSFTGWAGSLIPYGRDYHLILDDRRIELVDEVVRDLAGIGLERIAGYFGIEALEAWRGSEGQLQTIPTLEIEAVAARLRSGESLALDVRSEGEWKSGHLPGSLNLPVACLDQRRGEIPRDRPLIVHCQTGRRAAIAASLLRAHGFTDLSLFSGGFAEWSAAGLATSHEDRE